MSMDAKNKAKSLVDKFKPLVTTWDCYNDTPMDEKYIIADAKKCAIILVDKIIESNPMSPYNGDYYEIVDDRIEQVKEYWRQVKTEIEKL